MQEKVAKRGVPVENHSINSTLNYSPLIVPTQSPATHSKGIAVPGTLIILLYPVMSYLILSYPILSSHTIFCPILSCHILFYPHILHFVPRLVSPVPSYPLLSSHPFFVTNLQCNPSYMGYQHRRPSAYWQNR